MSPRIAKKIADLLKEGKKDVVRVAQVAADGKLGDRRLLRVIGSSFTRSKVESFSERQAVKALQSFAKLQQDITPHLTRQVLTRIFEKTHEKDAAQLLWASVKLRHYPPPSYYESAFTRKNLTAKDAATLLWCYAKLRHNPTTPSAVTSKINGLALVGSLQPLDISYCLYAYGVLRFTDVKHIVEAAKRNVTGLSPQGLAMCLYGMAKVKYSSVGDYKHLVKGRAGDIVGMGGIVNVIWAFCEARVGLGVEVHPVLRKLVGEKVVQGMSYEEISAVVSGFSMLVRDDIPFPHPARSVLRFITQRLAGENDIKASSTAARGIVMSLATLRMTSRPAFTSLEKNLLKTASTTPIALRAKILTSLTSARLGSDYLATILPLKDPVNALDTLTLSLVVYSAARLAVSPDVSGVDFTSRVDDFSSKMVANTMWGLSVTRCLTPPTAITLSKHLSTIDTPEPQHISASVTGLAISRITATPAVALLSNITTTHTPTTSIDTLAAFTALSHHNPALAAEVARIDPSSLTPSMISRLLWHYAEVRGVENGRKLLGRFKVLVETDEASQGCQAEVARSLKRLEIPWK